MHYSCMLCNFVLFVDKYDAGKAIDERNLMRSERATSEMNEEFELLSIDGETVALSLV